MDADEGTEQKTPVATVFAHEGYVSDTGDSNIALLQLNASVSLNRGVIPMSGSCRTQYSHRSQFNFTDSMLCTRCLEGNQQSFLGVDGSPLATLYVSTHFLTGVELSKPKVLWGLIKFTFIQVFI